MAKQVTTENVRREIARLIRLCRWSARKCHFSHEENIRLQEESIRTLQDLCAALGFKVPVSEREDLFVRGIYKTGRSQKKHAVRSSLQQAEGSIGNTAYCCRPPHSSPSL